jgi:hypothetical protein
MKWFIKKLHDYIDQSEYKAFNVRTHLGNWRQLTLRSNENMDLLAILIFDKQDLNDVYYLFIELIFVLLQLLHFK